LYDLEGIDFRCNEGKGGIELIECGVQGFPAALGRLGKKIHAQLVGKEGKKDKIRHPEKKQKCTRLSPMEKKVPSAMREEKEKKEKKPNGNPPCKNRGKSPSIDGERGKKCAMIRGGKGGEQIWGHPVGEGKKKKRGKRGFCKVSPKRVGPVFNKK